MRSFIDQGELQGPIFVTQLERLYLPNIFGHQRMNLTHGFYQIDFEPTRQKQSIFEFGVDGALLQATETTERPVIYFSNHLNRAKKNYVAGEKEMMAIVRLVEHFSLYLYPHPFKIRTDHRF